MATISVNDLQSRAQKIVSAAGTGEVIEMDSIPGAGSAPGARIASAGVVISGDYLTPLRNHRTPVIARVKDSKTFIDLRTVRPADDAVVIDALRSINGLR